MPLETGCMLPYWATYDLTVLTRIKLGNLYNKQEVWELEAHLVNDLKVVHRTDLIGSTIDPSSLGYISQCHHWYFNDVAGYIPKVSSLVIFMTNASSELQQHTQTC